MNALINFWLRRLSILILMACCLVPQQSAYADSRKLLKTFYTALESYGIWIKHRTYGQVWQPYIYSNYWRPYTIGHWEHTLEYGWYWVSNEPWGWAVYHYGRWAFDKRLGWLWVPGTVWAPAWVVWQYNENYFSWAILPPIIYWRPNLGLSFQYVGMNRIPLNYWVVLPGQYLTWSSNVNRHILPISYNHTQLNRLENSYSDLTLHRDQIYNPGVPMTTVEHELHPSLPSKWRLEAERQNVQPWVVAKQLNDNGKANLSVMDDEAAQNERDLALKLARETLKQEQKQLAQQPLVSGQDSGTSPIARDLQLEQQVKLQSDLQQQQQILKQQQMTSGSIPDPQSPAIETLRQQEMLRQQQLAVQQRNLEMQRQQDAQRQQQQNMQQQVVQQQALAEQQRLLAVRQQEETAQREQQLLAQQQLQMQQQLEMQRQQEQQQQLEEQQRQVEAQRQRDIEMQQAQQLAAQQEAYQRELVAQQQREIAMQQQLAAQQQQQREIAMQQQQQREITMQQQAAQQQAQQQMTTPQPDQRQVQEQQRLLELQRQQVMQH